MNRVFGWVVAIIIIAAIVVGGYFAFHKSSTQPVSTTSTTSPPNNSAYGSSNNTNSSNTKEAEVNNSVVITKNNSSVGNYLADPNGNTLYTDGTVASNCEGSCLAAWPAYQDKGATTGLPDNISTVKRPDNGQIQYTYKGMPLYYFVSDSHGQVTGNGISGFSVAKP